MFIRSITSAVNKNYKIVTNWGKKVSFTGTTFIGVEHHYYNDVLMRKRYVFANGGNKVFQKDRNLFGKFDRTI